MEGDHIRINHLLIPLSWLYGLGVEVRNILYDSGALRTRSFPLPVIGVGNLTVGGTGKTPHTEYLVRLISPRCQVAVLSRGYKRKSRGFQLATADTPMRTIGDEPYQIRQKFAGIHVAVSNDRADGIERLLQPSVQPPVDVVILDDSFQHRRITPGLNILLMDYHRLNCYDKLLPAGRLREPCSSIHRADIVIVTKCPREITPMERLGIGRSLGMQAWQKLFFTHFVYDDLSSLTAPADTIPLSQLTLLNRPLTLLTGIASPVQMEYDLRRQCPGIQFTSFHFPDHHLFTRSDLLRIGQAHSAAHRNGQRPLIITTEKDASRLNALRQGTPEERKRVATIENDIYVLPARVQFIGQTDGEKFNKTIQTYVDKNSIHR